MWTLSESNAAEMVLFTFDPADCSDAFLAPFQPLRVAFRANYHEWRLLYRVAIQDTKQGWESQCIFIPIVALWPAMEESARGPSRPTPTLFDRADTSLDEYMRSWLDQAPEI